MTTDSQHEQEILESRLDDLDRRTRTRRIVWGTVAAAAAVVVIGVGARAMQPVAPAPAATQKPLFASTSFGVPFTVQYLPSWLTTDTLLTDGEALEWVNWNRCPQNLNECIGLSFNRFSSVQLAKSREKVTFASYLAYLDQLGASGKVDITGRRETTVDGRRAVLLDITAPQALLSGLGCNELGSAQCDDFFAEVPGRYAVVDTGSLDPTGAVLVIYTRAGGIGPAEAGWLEQFDQMLTTLRFTKAASPSPSG